MAGRVIRVVTIGAAVCGKTSLLKRMINQDFDETSIPTTINNYWSIVQCNKERITVSWGDTSGEVNGGALRQNAFRTLFPNIILICFSIDDRESLIRVSDTFVLEARALSPGTDYILVGTKIDLRTHSNNPVTYEEGKAMASDIGAIDYYECSSKDNIGITELKNEILRRLGFFQKKEKLCSIM